MMRTTGPGEQIERYVIERKLSEGGMAEVYLARCGGGGPERRVVVKSVLPSFIDNLEFVAMMRNEARLAAGLSHPNIVRVEDLLESGGRPFIVMEYLEGQNLREIVYRALKLQRTLSLAFVCGTISKVLAGLDHAHDGADAEGRALGLVHRDVSLSNVIVTWRGEVKLIDFGIAKATSLNSDELTRVGQLKGKSAYMSPEQVRREPLDRRSDLFSVGIVLWEMLTQRRLFARRSEMDSMMAICCQDAAPPSSVAPELPEALDHICTKALARDREQRYQTAAAMRDDLEALLTAEGWTAGPAELEAELVSLFADESTAVTAAPLPALYAEEPTPVRSSGPAAIAIEPPRVTGATLRSTGVSLLNQRLPGPSVYEDYDWRGPRGSAERRRRREAMWMAVLSGCLLAALATLAQYLGALGAVR